MKESELDSKIEKILDKKLEEKLGDKLNQGQAEQVKQETKQDLSKREHEEEFSRRSFLKTLGAGAAGIGALSLLPSAASKVTISDTGITLNNTDPNGLILDKKEAEGLIIDKVSGDPSSPSTGQIWYDTTAD